MLSRDLLAECLPMLDDLKEFGKGSPCCVLVVVFRVSKPLGAGWSMGL